MARIFISHASANNAEALALRDWLVARGWDDLFLDIDPQRGLVSGQRWLDSPDGDRIVTASGDKTARVWSRGEDGAWHSVALQGHQGPVNSASFSPDGGRHQGGPHPRRPRGRGRVRSFPREAAMVVAADLLAVRLPRVS